jgi:hypothetical protein
VCSVIFSVEWQVVGHHLDHKGHRPLTLLTDMDSFIFAVH